MIIMLLIINIINGAIKEMKRYRLKDYLKMSGLGFLGLFMYSALYYYGIAVLSSQEACILNYLWPMMIVLFACLLLRETLTVKKAIAMVMSFAGIVVLTLGSGGGSSGNRLFGIIACVAAAVCYGLFSVLNKKHSLNQSVTMMWIWLTVAVCSAVSGLIIEAWQPITGWQWAGVAWLGIVVNAVAYLLWALALKGARDSAKIANLAYLVPFLSIVLTALILKEQIACTAAIALVLIIGGILLQSIQIKKRSKNGQRRL
ncbi:MAG: DMT family transporter [Ruminococcus sp.]|nr:DMT family transporter [Ruminococcus sp.]